jgi:hypothetical protein
MVCGVLRRRQDAWWGLAGGDKMRCSMVGRDRCSNVRRRRIVLRGMPVRLVQHTADSINGGLSPFASELSSMVGAGTADIACPYISVSYVEQLLSETPSWRILTNAQELLSTSRHRAEPVGKSNAFRKSRQAPGYVEESAWRQSQRESVRFGGVRA